MITCYSNQNKNAVIPCKYIWYRNRNGLTTSINNIKGSTYMC